MVSAVSLRCVSVLYVLHFLHTEHTIFFSVSRHPHVTLFNKDFSYQRGLFD